MAITFTQTLITAINTNSGTTATGKFSAAATAGRFVVVVIKVSGGFFVTSVSDAKGNTWVNPSYNLSSGPDVEIWYTYVTNGISTNDLLTVVANGGTTQITNIIAASFSQVSTFNSSYYDLSTGANTVLSGAATTKTIALGTTVAPELIIAAVGTSGASSQTFTSSTGSVIASTDTTKQTALVYQIQASRGAANPVVSWSSSTSFVFAGVSFYPLGSSLTKTQTGVSRVANNLTSTQPAVSRIAQDYTKTQTATANITGSKVNLMMMMGVGT